MIQVGRFHLDVDGRALRHGDHAVPIGSRAFDILAQLAAAGGRLVTKDELMRAVWPKAVVEENNIQVHLSALRKALGDDRQCIVTVPGRGYRLLRARATADEHAPLARRLPRSRIAFFGRETAIEQICAMFERTRVLTLAGAGGIGKTCLAIEAAHRMTGDHADAPTFVELAALSTRAEVMAAILREDRRGLLVLDNAEHVIDHVADAVEALAATNTQLRILVTSREPLRVKPELIYRVSPLRVPPAHCSDDELPHCASVQLFVQRATSLQSHVCDDARALRLVAEICRRLDGIPLAIELAAARASSLGVEGVCRRLDDRMKLLAGGYRTAWPRHQTLRATFDWSFDLLGAHARTLLKRLAVFGSAFNFDQMCVVVCCDELDACSALAAISELASKSLVNVDVTGSVAMYRLSESTRAYALEKLHAKADANEMAARLSRAGKQDAQRAAASPDRIVSVATSPG
ncbi:ATP-binding protein [Caballeronia cordobensis]|uniref:ATP-binding protein n=1 Tax=Caballeronia cordobensis TaxID=1353886 RepID=UPI0006AD7FDD|nr:winged helix-turn-helix domain-containing protein [Caballeronia cordobensis]